MRFWGLILLLLALAGCSDDSWELSPVEGKVEETFAGSSFTSDPSDELITNYLKKLFVETETSVEQENLRSLVNILGSIGPGKYIYRNLDFLNVLENDLDQDKFAKKKAKDDFYNIKYSMLFDLRSQESQGVSRSAALKSIERKTIALLGGVKSFEGIELEKIVKEFVKQIKNDDTELSSTQKKYLSKLEKYFKEKHLSDLKSFAELKDFKVQESGEEKVLLLNPRVTHLEMPVVGLKGFEKRTRLSIYGGEIETGPIVKFEKWGQVTLHKIWDGKEQKAFLCSLKFTAKPQVFSEKYLVSMPFFKDAKKVSVSVKTGLYSFSQEMQNEDMISICEKENFSVQRETLEQALVIKAGEMVFQSDNHQCQANAECERWYNLNVTKVQKKGRHFICDQSKKNFVFNSCIIAGGKGSPCRVLEAEGLKSPGIGESSCLPSLKCVPVKKKGWLLGGKILQQAKGICL